MINMNGCKLNTMTGKQRVENEKKNLELMGMLKIPVLSQKSEEGIIKQVNSRSTLRKT